MKKVKSTLQSKEIENGIYLSIDWEFLASGKGFRKVENALQFIVGKIFFWLSFASMLVIFATELIQQHWLSRIIQSEGLTSLLFWVSLFFFLYSLYLMRDRGMFIDRVRKGNLQDLRKDIFKGKKLGKVELTDYINPYVLWTVDLILSLSTKQYVEEFFKRLIKLRRAKTIIERLGLSQDELKEVLARMPDTQEEKKEFIQYVLTEAFLSAYDNHLKLVDERTVCFIFIRDVFSENLKTFNIVKKDIDGILLWIRNEALKQHYADQWRNRVSIKPKSTVNRAYTSRYTPTLNRFSRDFTHGVMQGDFTVSIAREDELQKLVNILEKGSRSAVLVVGEPGVGKTTLIKSLAVRMVVEDVPKKLQDMRLVGFDFNKAFSASKDIESFKRKLRSVFDEVTEAKNVILVLDNFNQLLNLRRELSGEIANIIIDSFDASNIRLIATTDRSQFIRFIRPNRALAGMFSSVEMAIPSDEIATQIAIDEIPKIQGDYGVKISFSAIKAAVELSHKFAYDRVLPDKAIEILKESVVAYKQLAGQKPLEYDEVARVISSKVGVNLGSITEDEAEKLARLEEEMHTRIVDQNEAVNAVSGALRRSRSGLGEEGKPIASFLFFGPTGVGKTEIAKTVADIYFGNEDRMVRVDMSEYQEAENLKRLIGFISQQGVFEGGFLTEPVHKNPFSLVLLDEIDKANPKVLDLFLQVLDEGYVDDGLGRKIDFSNTIIIATSNAGSSVIAGLLEEGKKYKEVHKRALEELKKVFRIEFLNRFDKIIMFKPLSREDVQLVAKKFVEQVRLKLLDKGITLTYGNELLERLAKLGYNPVFGAREMRRVVQEEVENKVAEMMVARKVKAGGEVKL